MRKLRSLLLVPALILCLGDIRPVRAGPLDLVLHPVRTAKKALIVGGIVAGVGAMACAASARCLPGYKQGVLAARDLGSGVTAGGTASEMSRGQREKSMGRQRYADTGSGYPDPDDPREGKPGRSDRGKAREVPSNQVLQTSGRTFEQRSADVLNDRFGLNLNRREWGRALEELKEAHGLRGDDHGRFLANGDFELAGKKIANILDFVR
jgi:hypothetical protein